MSNQRHQSVKKSLMIRKKTVNRDKIARELLAERDKQKEQKQQLRDEKVSQLKNKFGKDNS